MPANTVKVCRPGKWGNPFAIGEHGVKDRAQAVELHRQEVAQWPPDKVAEAINELRGKNLACWCPLDGPCHADTLLALVNRNDGRSS